jgi:hypothetical protein
MQWLKKLFGRSAAVRAESPAVAVVSPPVEAAVLVSEDLEVAQFMLNDNEREWPVHVSVEALASSTEQRIAVPDDAVALVRRYIEPLRGAARNALRRGDVFEGVVLIRPEDLEVA